MKRHVALAVLASAVATVAFFAGWIALAGTPEEQEVKVRAGEFWFKPKEVTVKPGVIRFLVKNDGLVAHTYVIEKVKDARINEFDPGKTATLKITLQAGKYTAFCDVPGHRDAGMVMTIVVK